MPQATINSSLIRVDPAVAPCAGLLRDSPLEKACLRANSDDNWQSVVKNRAAELGHPEPSLPEAKPTVNFLATEPKSFCYCSDPKWVSFIYKQMTSDIIASSFLSKTFKASILHPHSPPLMININNKNKTVKSF